MNYSMKTPCHNCPFRIEGGIRLTRDRAEEIALTQLDSQGATFTCHKTTVDSENDEGEGDRVDGPNAQYCAGAMIFALKNESCNQMLRIAGRLGLWKPSQFTNQDEVFDDIDAMVDAQEERPRRKRQRA